MKIVKENLLILHRWQSCHWTITRSTFAIFAIRYFEERVTFKSTWTVTIRSDHTRVNIVASFSVA
jgi:hypothetical protein